MTLPYDDDGNINRGATIISDIETASDAAMFLGVPPDASDDEIDVSHRELSMELHPDRGGSNEAFKALQMARDFLKEYPGGDMDDAEDYRSWEVDGPWEPGTPGFRAVNEGEIGRYVNTSSASDTGSPGVSETKRERDTGRDYSTGQYYQQERERYEETKEDVKITFVEQVLQVDLSNYDTVGDAVNDGVITKGDVELVEEVLGEAYNTSGATLDEVAGVVASLVVTGAINLGKRDFFTETPGSLGGSGTGSLGGRSGSLGGRGTGSLGK